MGGVSEELLTEMVQAIVREADPERIYLFGSQARAEATEDSDVDLLVVTREAEGGDEAQRVWRALADFPVSKDIILFSLEEFEWRRKGRNNVVARAVREGRLLYERPAGGAATAADRGAGAAGAQGHDGP